MKRHSVVSSSISSMGYDNGKLEVEFNNGNIYSYENVPEDLYQELRVSSSVGKMFAAKVIKGGYKYKKIS
jgi:hypothetical protein